MRHILFSIGCVLFFWGLLLFVIWTTGSLFNDQVGLKPINLNYNIYFTTVIFFVGTYLISNNKPEDK
jgi:hypothetical protein